MKGLLLKDIYNLSQLGKQYLLIMIAMIVWAAFMKNPSFVSMYVAICSSTLVFTSFSFDEYAGFDKYALTMPIEKKTLVQEKYVLLLLTVVGGTAAGIPLAGLLNLLAKEDFMEIVVTAIVISCVFLISYSAVFPTVFKVGVEKARIMMVGVYLGIFILIFGLAKLLGQTDGMDKFHFLDWTIPVMAIAVSAVVTAISYFKSLRVIEKKEW